MMKDVIIKIAGTQGADGDENTIELTTEARYGFKDSEALISYDEGEMLGVKGVKTLLHYKAPDTVILKRSGALESRLIIQKNKKNCCKYDTGYGELLIDIIGEEIESSLNENGGSFYMSYSIDAGNRLLSKNRIKITIREV